MIGITVNTEFGAYQNTWRSLELPGDFSISCTKKLPELFPDGEILTALGKIGTQNIKLPFTAVNTDILGMATIKPLTNMNKKRFRAVLQLGTQNVPGILYIKALGDTYILVQFISSYDNNLCWKVQGNNIINQYETEPTITDFFSIYDKEFMNGYNDSVPSQSDTSSFFALFNKYAGLFTIIPGLYSFFSASVINNLFDRVFGEWLDRWCGQIEGNVQSDPVSQQPVSMGCCLVDDDDALIGCPVNTMTSAVAFQDVTAKNSKRLIVDFGFNSEWIYNSRRYQYDTSVTDQYGNHPYSPVYTLTGDITDDLEVPGWSKTNNAAAAVVQNVTNGNANILIRAQNSWGAVGAVGNSTIPRQSRVYSFGGLYNAAVYGVNLRMLMYNICQAFRMELDDAYMEYATDDSIHVLRWTNIIQPVQRYGGEFEVPMDNRWNAPDFFMEELYPTKPDGSLSSTMQTVRRTLNTTYYRSQHMYTFKDMQLKTPKSVVDVLCKLAGAYVEYSPNVMPSTPSNTRVAYNRGTLYFKPLTHFYRISFDFSRISVDCGEVECMNDTLREVNTVDVGDGTPSSKQFGVMHALDNGGNPNAIQGRTTLFKLPVPLAEAQTAIPIDDKQVYNTQVDAYNLAGYSVQRIQFVAQPVATDDEKYPGPTRSAATAYYPFYRVTNAGFTENQNLPMLACLAYVNPNPQHYQIVSPRVIAQIHYDLPVAAFNDPNKIIGKKYKKYAPRGKNAINTNTAPAQYYFKAARAINGAFTYLDFIRHYKRVSVTFTGSIIELTDLYVKLMPNQSIQIPGLVGWWKPIGNISLKGTKESAELKASFLNTSIQDYNPISYTLPPAPPALPTYTGGQFNASENNSTLTWRANVNNANRMTGYGGAWFGIFTFVQGKPAHPDLVQWVPAAMPNSPIYGHSRMLGWSRSQPRGSALIDWGQQNQIGVNAALTVYAQYRTLMTVHTTTSDLSVTEVGSLGTHILDEVDGVDLRYRFVLLPPTEQRPAYMQACDVAIYRCNSSGSAQTFIKRIPAPVVIGRSMADGVMIRIASTAAGSGGVADYIQLVSFGEYVTMYDVALTPPGSQPVSGAAIQIMWLLSASPGVTIVFNTYLAGVFQSTGGTTLTFEIATVPFGGSFNYANVEIPVLDGYDFLGWRASSTDTSPNAPTGTVYFNVGQVQTFTWLALWQAESETGGTIVLTEDSIIG